jgi:hypothetical protein
MRLFPHEVAIGILEDAFEEGTYPDPRTAFDGKEGALSFLRDLTGEDFGYDTAKWRDWFKRCSREMLDLHRDELARKDRARRARGG